MDETIGATDAEWALSAHCCRLRRDVATVWMVTIGGSSPARCGWRGQARNGVIFRPATASGTPYFGAYRRWVEQGVFDALLERLAELVGRDRSADMIDSTVVRAHHCAAGIKKALSRPRRSVDRGEGSQPNSMPAATPGGCRSPSS